MQRVVRTLDLREPLAGSIGSAERTERLIEARRETSLGACFLVEGRLDTAMEVVTDQAVERALNGPAFLLASIAKPFHAERDVALFVSIDDLEYPG